MEVSTNDPDVTAQKEPLFLRGLVACLLFVILAGSILLGRSIIELKQELRQADVQLAEARQRLATLTEENSYLEGRLEVHKAAINRIDQFAAEVYPKLDRSTAMSNILNDVLQSLAHVYEHDDILEAVFRYQMKEYRSIFAEKATAFFLAFGAEFKPTDPPEAFLSRFANDKVSVKKYSDSQIDTGGRFRDKSTAAYGCVLQLRGISRSRLSLMEASVGGTFYDFSHGFGPPGYTYIVERDGSKWTVKRAQQVYVR